jgi:SagB-type dehydrogenase family enzyme
MQNKIERKKMRKLIGGMAVFYLIATPLIARCEMQDSLPIGPRFHYETCFGDNGSKGIVRDWGKSLPLYKIYEGAQKTKLLPYSREGISVSEAIATRKSIRSFSSKKLTLELTGQILQAADGITHYYGKTYALRSAPSGGALYPIDIYVVSFGIDSIPDGLHHFQVSDTSLELVKPGDFRQQIKKASFDQESVGASLLTIILTARFPRITRKYADRGFRYAYIESGAICQNIYLEATSLGLGAVAVGAFNDDALNRFLEIDGVEEAALLIMPVGYPAE